MIRSARRIVLNRCATTNDVRLHENRDAHNWVAWRDTLEPHLRELIEAVA